MKANAFLYLGESGNAVTPYDANESQPKVFMHNAIVGYSGDEASLYDHGSMDIVALNAYSSFNGVVGSVPCGKGGNIEVVYPSLAGFMSLDPESSDYLKPIAGGAVVDMAGAFPHECPVDRVSEPADTDLSGQPTPCGFMHDIGCYEYCPAD